MQTRNSSCRCRTGHKVKKKTRVLPVLTGVLIALLPKCPFCIMAYSSAITLCSGAKIYDHSPAWTSWISVGLALITFLLVLWNFKGWRTWLSAGLILLGSYFILDSEMRTGDITLYYWGSLSLLAGVWINGSFFYFFSRYINPFLRNHFSFNLSNKHENEFKKTAAGTASGQN